MAAPACTRSLRSVFKRMKLSPSFSAVQSKRDFQSSSHCPAETNESIAAHDSLPTNLSQELAQIRLPKAVQATYLRPLQRRIIHDIPSADLQIRSYNVRNLEVFTDFAMRAAYFLKLPAKTPKPLRRITERWTVPRSNFVHKKSQENFQRITMRRLIRIVDGNPETINVWLAFLKKHQYYGVGMKADVYDYSGIEVAKEMDAQADSTLSELAESDDQEAFSNLANLGKGSDEALERKLHTAAFKSLWGAAAPMSANRSVPSAKTSMQGVSIPTKPQSRS